MKAIFHTHVLIQAVDDPEGFPVCPRRTSHQSCCCFTSFFRSATRTSLSTAFKFGLPLFHPRMHHALSFVHSQAFSTVWMVLGVPLGFAPAVFSGARDRRIRCSVNCIEVAVHLKVQYSALSGPAQSSAHFGVHACCPTRTLFSAGLHLTGIRSRCVIGPPHATQADPAGFQDRKCVTMHSFRTWLNCSNFDTNCRKFCSWQFALEHGSLSVASRSAPLSLFCFYFVWFCLALLGFAWLGSVWFVWFVCLFLSFFVVLWWPWWLWWLWWSCFLTRHSRRTCLSRPLHACD